MTSPPSVKQDSRFHERLKAVNFSTDIPKRWQNTPVEKMILAHNFDRGVETSGMPELMLVTCIDYRIMPKIPERFAYVLRRAAGSLAGLEFNLSYALAKGVKHLVILAHNDCGMTRVPEHREPILNALLEQGWEKQDAENFIDQHAGNYAIPGELEALESEYDRICQMFKNLEVAPLFVSLAENHIYIPNFYLDRLQTSELDKVSTGSVLQL